MKVSLPFFALLALSALGTLPLSCPLSARAQSNSPITITKVEATLVTSPIYAVTASPNAAPVAGQPGKWLQVDFTYSVNSEDLMVKEVQFRVYAEVDDLAVPTDKTGPGAYLYGEGTYLNIPNGKDYHGSFYIHPFTVQRFGGESSMTYQDPKGKNIRVEADIDSQQAGYKDLHDDDPNWVSQAGRKIAGMILPRELTPWALINADRYPPVKLRTGGD